MAQYGSKGLSIVGTPCAQFDNQEPGTNAEILNCLRYVRPGSGFAPAFPLTQKLDVNGMSADPLWSTMREYCPSPVTSFVGSFFVWSPVTPTDVAWNFEKVLLDSETRPIARYASTVLPSDIGPDIARLLGTT